VATQAERNARLDQLRDAATSWADKEEARLKKQTALLKRILKGRTGSERLNNASTEAASDLLVDEINQFLTGD
jgi:hypothetical protein